MARSGRSRIPRHGDARLRSGPATTPASFLRLWACYALGYLLITPLFAGTEELWGESLNDVFVGVASLIQYATAHGAGWVSDSAFFWIGLPLNALAYGLGFAAVHRWLSRAQEGGGWSGRRTARLDRPARASRLAPQFTHHG